ncbi:MAG TPA: hypothetical protein VJL35_14100 [Gemmatimonadaceae bacterium]|jgi:hypothetical protein|nr:hypothetical protein [Gemmatimonadaceae bacterium]
MTATDEIVPISTLFFDGPGPHVVRAGFPPRNASGKYTPARGQELQALLNTSIVQLGAVSGEGRRRTPVRPQPAVSIDALLYRGRAALERALEVRQEIVTGGGQSREQVEELLDLVALAATE